ncbi:MAG: sigma 54-interacting transcriptional regulator [Bdellovibrionales bacterium]|nr:sigma 54-interacting transcriptional regulator [Bdellovibrionales bacterium]
MVSPIREVNHNLSPGHILVGGLSSVDRQVNELFSLAETVAKSKASVLILGEFGTGKRTLARFIHEKSARSSRPFYIMNCRETAVGEQELLFRSLEEQARGSTLILAEIWKLTPAVQMRLLDLIQSGADVRIVATSSRSLSNLVRNGDFKEELFYRLNVVNLKIPSLQERLGDIELFARGIVSRIASEQGRQGLELSQEAVLLMNSHRWPGNIRELEAVCERAVLLAQGNEIRARDVQFQASGESRTAGESPSTVWRPGKTLDEIERNVILEALKHFGGNRTHTAKALGISIRTLRNKLAEFRVMGIKA